MTVSNFNREINQTRRYLQEDRKKRVPTINTFLSGMAFGMAITNLLYVLF